MSTKGEVLYHPINRSEEQTWNGFSWPAFFFGVFWLLIKGLWAHFLISVILMIVTGGFAAPIIWIAYGFIGNGAHRSALVKKGYLFEDQRRQTEKGSPQKPTSPGDALEQLSKLSALRDKGALTEDEYAVQKSRILNS